MKGLWIMKPETRTEGCLTASGMESVQSITSANLSTTNPAQNSLFSAEISGSKPGPICQSKNKDSSPVRKAAPANGEDSNPASGILLVGAGCHDASWLSHEARKALEEADAIVYDDLVDETVLELAKKAVKIYRGKRGHMKSADQQEINTLLADLASRYSRVVRLKGGDPMIFGRGMEEIESLEKQGTKCRIIPGISSFYGIPAKELLGLTKRNEAGGFMVLTAHRAGKERSDQQWREIAGFEGTIVFMMGMHEVSLISKKLISAGKDSHTACAVLTSPLFTLTKSVKTTLEHLPQAVQDSHLKSPGIIVIGGSAGSYKPLNPRYIGLSSSAMLNEKIKKDMPPHFQFASLLKTEYEDYALDLSLVFNQNPDWLVFTSAHGASAFCRLLEAQKIDVRKLALCKIACIGNGTAEVFKKHLILPDLVPDHPDGSRQLAAQLKRLCLPESKVFLFQSGQALGILEKELKDRTMLQSFPLYNFQTIPTRAALAPVVFDALVLASRNAARAYLSMNPRPQVRVLIAFSKEIAGILKDGLKDAGENEKPEIWTADHPDAHSVSRLLLKRL